jgi:hypothetical protein
MNSNSMDWFLEQSTMDPFSRAFRRLNFDLPSPTDEPDLITDDLDDERNS